jgi:hypothetical protein
VLKAPTYSHPHEPVRHSYPLAVESAGVLTAIGLLCRTAPYLVVRFAILVGVTIVTVLWFGVTVGGGGFLADKVHPWVGYGWLATGLGAYGWIWATVLRYVLYLLKCGHIAVLTELITTGSIGNGSEGMFSYGKRIVTERFGEVNMLFALDVIVAGIVSAFNRSLEWITSFLPLPGLKQLVQVFTAVVRAATTYVDETILSYNLARRDENPWRGARDGLIYYCQNNRAVLMTAVWCVLLDYVLTVLAWFALLIPAGLLSKVMPFLGAWPLAIGVLFALNIREAVLKPLFLVMIMTKFHVAIKAQPINEEWDAKLTELTPKFGQLKDKISSYLPLQREPVAQDVVR